MILVLNWLYGTSQRCAVSKLYTAVVQSTLKQPHADIAAEAKDAADIASRHFIKLMCLCTSGLFTTAQAIQVYQQTEEQVAFGIASQRIMPNITAALCRAARFCNGAAHGGQVVGPSTIIPGLLQAWGCKKIPDAQSSGTDLQVCP